jgi:predicted ribosome quality control (RQC) complex YloA/Tae2 family protein
MQEMDDFKSLKTVTKKENSKDDKVQKSSPYWTFQVEGLEVFVGKNAKSNDELLRLTKKNDWWFHAKDVAGSHCVVRNGGVDLTPVQLEKVGALAAHYSKAKSQSVVPVIYTPRKHVRKPKGFPPGKVIVEKESVVLVEPSGPQNL